MKQRILTLSLITITLLSACQKDTVAPSSKTATTINKSVTSTPVLNSTTTVPAPVIPANITGYLRVQLAKDAINTSNIMISFKPGTSAAYVKNEDATTLTGFGVVALSSLSTDGMLLAINAQPLEKANVNIALSVNATTDGAYRINMLTIGSIPAVYNIYLKDKVTKDSVNMRTTNSYAFNLKLADTASYGNHRFSLALHAK